MDKHELNIWIEETTRMKRILIGLTVLLVAANVAKAQTIESDLTGLGIKPEVASYLASVIPLGSTFDNAAWFKARNAADSADIDVLRVDATDDTELNADVGDVIKLRIGGDANRLFTFNASSDTAHSLTFGDGGTTATQDFTISASNADADDDSILYLTGGGAYASNGTRGAYIAMKGNEASGAGDVVIAGGSAAGSDISLSPLASDGRTILGANGANRWIVASTGALQSDATNGGSLVFLKAGTSVVEYVGTLAAAGSTQADAGQIVTQLTTITAADATKGVKLPATPVAGETYTVINTANAVLKLYPGTGDTLSGLAANANMSLAAYTYTICVAVSASAYWCGEPAVAA